MTRYYDWDGTWSRQTGTNGEFCLVVGGKDIGKTFGLRLKCAIEAIAKDCTIVEFCRTLDEASDVGQGYFDKIQEKGYLADWQFMTHNRTVWYCDADIEKPKKADWKPIVYLVALTMFQKEKRRTYAKVKRMIFDEAVIDVNDRYHRYLPNEFYILANLIDTVTREQPNDDAYHRIYLLGNAVDIGKCPYFRNLGITKVPRFGYSWYNHKNTLLHYVEPWDSEERREKTLVGRMLRGNDAARVIFDNEFDEGYTGDIASKPANAVYRYGIVYAKTEFSIWSDRKRSLWYIQEGIPKNAGNVCTLTKKDGTLRYKQLKRGDAVLDLMLDLHYAGAVRYSNLTVKTLYMEILGYLGVK